VADRHLEAEGSEDPALAIAARHALHDEELIAAFATDGDAVEGADRARSFVERCVACRDLHADLVTIGGMLRAGQNAEAVAATRPAPRDFRLSIETANRLRPGSVVLRSRDRLAAAIGSFSRSVGLSMASLGVVGLLFGTLAMGGFTNFAPAPQDQGVPGAAGAPTAGSGEVTGPLGTRLDSLRGSFETLATTPPPTESVVPAQGPLSAGGPTVATLIVAGSIALLIGGLAVLMLGSRRREPVPGR
jgi:hypothetical protein